MKVVAANTCNASTKDEARERQWTSFFLLGEVKIDVSFFNLSFFISFFYSFFYIFSFQKRMIDSSLSALDDS